MNKHRNTIIIILAIISVLVCGVDLFSSNQELLNLASKAMIAVMGVYVGMSLSQVDLNPSKKKS